MKVRKKPPSSVLKTVAFAICEIPSGEVCSQAWFFRTIPSPAIILPNFTRVKLDAAQLSLFVPSAFGNSGLTKDSKGTIEAGFRGCFRCHVFRPPEDFYAERIVVVDALERLQEAGQVDDTFAG